MVGRRWGRENCLLMTFHILGKSGNKNIGRILVFCQISLGPLLCGSHGLSGRRAQSEGRCEEAKKKNRQQEVGHQRDPYTSTSNLIFIFHFVLYFLLNILSYILMMIMRST